MPDAGKADEAMVVVGAMDIGTTDAGTLTRVVWVWV